MNLTAYQNIYKTSRVWALYPIKHSSLTFCIKRILIRLACFSCMLISFPHNLNLCSDSPETCFLRNVFEAVLKTRSTYFIGSTTRLRLVVLNPIKHDCSFFKHYIKNIFYDNCYMLAVVANKRSFTDHFTTQFFVPFQSNLRCEILPIFVWFPFIDNFL